MPKPLIIVESPAKARTIEKFLGRQYRVKASLGHLIDLPKSKLGVDVDHGFEPQYITIRGKTQTLRELQEAAKEADRVLLATDPDREGEAIAWHLSKALEVDGQPCRVTFREITAEAVRQAVANPRLLDLDRVHAQQARRILDRLVGYELSPLLWKKVQRGLSAGRVQSVAVRLIVDREREIEAFQREEFWTITAWLRQVGATGSPVFPAKLATLHGHKVILATEAEAQAALAALSGLSYTVAGVSRKARRRQPPPPFITSTLQQEAARRHGFAARRTMQAAQQLYEGLDLGPYGRTGLITYMRTDSTRVSAEAVQQARAYISGAFGADYCGRGGPARGSGRKKAPPVQDAHEAIRPTDLAITPDQVQPHLTGDQQRIYRLVWERFLASQMAAAVLDVVSAELEAGPWGFRASGQTVRFAGFLQVYSEAREEGDQADGQEAAAPLPDLAPGETLEDDRVEPKQHFTQPPPRYSEASLVKTMEELGIGRPSTYAPIIETIQARNYVRQEARRFAPTPLGTTVTDLLRARFPGIVDIGFTAGMESRLDQVERGQQDWQQLLAEFYGPFKDSLRQAEESLGRVQVPVEQTDIACDKCGAMMVIRHGRFGPFLACPRFPECRNAKPLAKKVAAATCPLCQGAILEKKSKRGRRFYGCERYPECGFTSWNKPQAQRCPQCGSFMVQKRSGKSGTSYACASPSCGLVVRSKPKGGGTQPDQDEVGEGGSQ